MLPRPLCQALPLSENLRWQKEQTHRLGNGQLDQRLAADCGQYRCLCTAQRLSAGQCTGQHEAYVFVCGDRVLGTAPPLAGRNLVCAVHRAAE